MVVVRSGSLALISHNLYLQHLTSESISVDMANVAHNVYPYSPSHAAAIVLSIAIAASLSLHVYQGL